MAQDGGELTEHQILDQRGPFGCRGSGDLCTPVRYGVVGTARVGGAGLRCRLQHGPVAGLSEEEPGRPGADGPGVEPLEVDVGDHDVPEAAVKTHRPVQRAHRPVRGHRLHREPVQPVRDDLTALQSAAARPVPPADGQRGQPERPTPQGERVEERVARRVAALPGVGGDPGERGEQDEQFQREIPGQLVQVPRRERLHP